MKIHSMGDKFFHVNRQTPRQTRRSYLSLFAIWKCALKTVKFFHPTCRLNEFSTGDSKMGKSDDASLVIELAEERRDLPPAEGAGGESDASPCKSTDWNSPLFEGEF